MPTVAGHADVGVPTTEQTLDAELICVGSGRRLGRRARPATLAPASTRISRLIPAPNIVDPTGEDREVGMTLDTGIFELDPEHVEEPDHDDDGPDKVQVMTK